MSEITEFMNGVKEYAIDHNIDFVMITNEGEVRNGTVFYVQREKKEIVNRGPLFRDFCFACKYMHDDHIPYLIKGDPDNTSEEPAIYIIYDEKSETIYSYNIKIKYEGVMYPLFEFTWFITGWKPTLMDYKIGLLSLRILDNQLIGLMKSNNNLTEEIIDKEFVFNLSSILNEENFRIVKDLPYDESHTGKLRDKWDQFMDWTFDAMKFFIKKFQEESYIE